MFKIYKENNLGKKEQCGNTCVNILSIQPYLRGPKVHTSDKEEGGCQTQNHALVPEFL